MKRFTRTTIWMLTLLLGLSSSGIAAAGVLPESGEAQYELAFWESIKNSTQAEDYEAYLKAYPNGRFAPLARVRAARYAKSTAKPAVPSAPSAPSVEHMDAQYVAVVSADVHVEPNLQSETVTELKHGNRVHVTGRTKDKNWYRIRTDSGTTGFVYSKLLQEPVTVAPQPTPSPAPQPTQPPKPVVKPEGPPVAAHKTSTIKDCSDCPELVVLQPGSFIMGDDGGDRSERPAHRVRIGKAFAIGKYEVTMAQWNACVRAKACEALPQTESLSDKAPAINVSWNDAEQYVQWLSKHTGQDYRLPTEAEWEYAARAGTQSRYWWGGKMESGKANCKDCGGAWSQEAPVNVDALPPNAFGIYGTSGGVWEWVQDCWHKSYRGAPTHGSAWTRAGCRENVIRGGSWRNDQSYSTSSSRFTYDSTVRFIANGFRVAKTLR